MRVGLLTNVAGSTRPARESMDKEEERAAP